MSRRKTPETGEHMHSIPHIPETAGMTEKEMAMLDVDLDRVWGGVMGEVWARPVGRIERISGRLLHSPALARVLVTSPALILAWIIASAVVFALGVIVTQATAEPLIPLLAPALAAVGVAYAYGAGADVAYEITRTMPVSARMILLVRIAVVFAINTVMGGVASTVTPALGGVTALWLLPMVAISLIGLAVATVTGSPVAGGGAGLLVWGLIVLQPVLEERRERAVEIDLGQAVSASTLAAMAPLYFAAIAASVVIVVWQNGAFGAGREGFTWR